MKNYQVNLQFTADTNQARTQLQSLQQQLTAIANMPVNVGERLTPSIQQATNAAAELKVHLQNAMNVNTGTLDFGKFNNSIKQSGMTLSEYGAKLQSLGPKGQQAFMTLANSVAAAEVPLRRSSSALTGMMTTLKNTAKWQLSSSLLHGFISSVQSAYGYAQDLNESLNNIRIVTGQNIDQMARFAAEANKAAKALSATTTDYTNASLIYYQQGLSDAQVKERANITIKMANASRQSAEIVSDQLTAIWNNFDNGTKTLEYYADVVTALGAATASSSEEIAAGLEKFASVAETVGLSYEYATAALATVTATTRQSADVVGTAFKTLFARLQDLKLGETLDDGTTLGTYSENLAKIGVNIKSTSGELKDMDVILNEVAEKWKTLDRDQQVALAKGVAGIRQYNTFMSLMSNWDFMQENLKTVENASGSLQKQADIYAESWEAAQKRVKASAEKLYSALFDDKFFIDLTNGFGSLIDKVGEFIKSIGGLQGVLSSLGFIVTKVFAQQMATGFKNLVYNIKMSTEAGRFAVQEAKKAEMEKLAGMMVNSTAATGTEMQTKSVYAQELQLQTELIANSEKMTVEEQKKYQILLEQHRTIGQQSIELQKQIELLKEQNASTSLEVIGEGMLNNSGMTRRDSFQMMNAEMDKLRKGAAGLGEVSMALDAIGVSSAASEDDIMRLETALRNAGMQDNEILELGACFDDLRAGGQGAQVAMEEIKATLNSINSDQIKKILNKAGIDEGTVQYNRLTQSLRQYVAAGADAYVKQQQLDMSNENLKTSFKSLSESIRNAGINMQDWATHLTNVVSGIMSAGMLISSINGLMNTLEDPDASGWEKFGSVLTSVAMITMSFTGVIKGLTAVYKFATAALNKETLAKVANTLASYLQERQARKTAAAQDIEEEETRETTTEINKQTAAKIANKTVDQVDFKGKGGRTRTYAGAKNAKGHLLDTNGQVISDKYVKRYNLNTVGSSTGAGSKVPAGGSPAGGGKVAGQGAKSLLKPGTLKALGTFAGGALMVAGAVAIVATAITGAIAQYNQYEKAAQDAAAAAKISADRYNEVKQAYDDFISQTTDYKESVKAMEEMTKGTNEYREALLKANEQAMNLIKNYKDLATAYTIKDGLILIDEDALAKVQEKELEKLGQMQSASIMSQITADQAQAKSDKVDLTRKMDTDADNSWTGKNAAAMGGVGAVAGALGTAGIGMMIGSSVPVIGTIIGGLVGLIVGGITGAIATEVAGATAEAENQALDSILKHYKKDENKGMFADDKEFERVLRDEIKVSEDLIEGLVENREAIKELTDAELQRLAQERGQWGAAYSAYNINNADYINASNQEFLNNMSHRFKEENPDVVENLNTRVTSMSNERLYSEYLKTYLGENNVTGTTGQNYRITDIGGDSATLQKLNDEGVWETIGEAEALSKDIAQRNVANSLLLAEASKHIGDDVLVLDRLTADLNYAGLDSDTDKDVIAGILNSYSATGNVSLSGFNYNQIKDIDTSKITDSGLKAAVDGALENYYDGLSELEKEIVKSDWFAGLSETEQKMVWTIETDEQSTLDSVKSALESAQSYINANSLVTSIKVQNDIVSAYKSGDLEKFKELYTGENSPFKGQISYDDLMKMTPAEVLNFLESGGTSVGTALKETEKALKENQEDQDEQNKNLDAAKVKAYGQDRKADGVGGTEGALRTAENALATEKTATQNRRNQFITNTGYEANGETGWTDDKYTQIGGRVAISSTNYNRGVNQLHTQDTLNNLMTDFSALLGTDSEYYKLIQEYQKRMVTDDWGDVSEENAKWMKNTFAPAIAARIAQDPSNTDYATYKSQGYTEDEIAGMIAPYIYDHLIQFAESDGVQFSESGNDGGQQVWGLYDIIQGALTDDSKIDARRSDVTNASNTFKTDEIAAGSTGTAQTNLNNLKTKEVELYEKYNHQLFALQRQEAESLGLNIEQYEAYKEQLAATNAILKDNPGLLHEVTKAHLRAQRGLDTLSTNWNDWNEVMSNSDATIFDLAKVLPEIEEALADILDINVNDFALLPHDFVQKNWDLIQKVMEGVDGAAEDLQGLIAKEYLLNLDIDTTGVTGQIDTILGLLNDMPEEIEINTSLNTLGLTEALNTLLTDTDMTVAQMQSLLNMIGFEPEITYKEVPVAQAIAQSQKQTVEVIDPVSGEYKTLTAENAGTYAESGMVKIPVINGSTTQYKGNVGGYTPKPSGSGGSSKPAKPTKKADTVERYKEINDRIADQEKAMDKASKAADRLWGPHRIKALKDANDALEQNINLLKDKRAEAEFNLEVDKQALQDEIAKNAGITVTDAMFDENGNFTSYNEVLNGLYDELKREETNAGSEWNESEQKRIEAIQKRIDAVKEAIANYDETNTLIKDLDTEIQDAIYEWQDNNYEVLNVELEYELEINEKELEIVDYYLGKMGVDLYSYIEAMGQYNEQSAIYTDNLGQQEAYITKLTDAYNKGEISEQAYKEGLASSQSAIISNLQSLEESKQAMQDYYGNVMEMAIEEIGIYTSEMEQLNSVLDHYSNIMEMVGKQDDFTTKNKILTSKANNLKNELTAQSELYNRSSTEAEHWAKQMANLEATMTLEELANNNAYQTYKKNWQAAQAIASEAQDAMLSKTEEWAEAMKAIVENELADFAATLEEQLTGGVSFDEMLTSMERRSSLQEEYLTTTNKIYETNKLMRTAQQEIDKTSNTAAKRRLQNFINETNQLQNQTKLSQYELDIQQAKYDLLLAEIALEEAQNAKSTVRLSRDSEGNFGYVYTADSAAVSEAEQNLADKQNALYNIGLEGANDYQQKYAETLQESQEAITELTQMWMNGEITDKEEFERRKQEITEHYGAKLQQYSELHAVALSADSRVVADAWSSHFNSMMATTGEWESAVDGYFQSAAGSMETWAQVCATTLEKSKLNDVDTTLAGINEKSTALITTLVGKDGKGGLVDAMMDQVDAANLISESQITIQNAIDVTIGKFETLLASIIAAYTAMGTPPDPAISFEGGTYNPDGSYNTSGGSGSGSGGSGGEAGYDNAGYDTETVKKAQRFVGATADGKWGPKSKEAAKKQGYNSLAAVVAAMNSTGKTPSSPTIEDVDNIPKVNVPSSPHTEDVDSYDTGGYTGSWGSYGKLAMIHEKELILNPRDTENFLASMNVLERILQVLDLQAVSSQLGGLLTSPGLPGAGGVLEQNVHIEASFPNVTDHNEIEEAFGNLINLASQYANRK